MCIVTFTNWDKGKIVITSLNRFDNF